MKKILVAFVFAVAAFKGYDLMKVETEQSAVAKNITSHQERLAAITDL